MRRRMRATALAAALLVNAHGLAQPAPPQGLALASALEPLFAGLRAPGARVGVVVMDAASGQVLFQHDPDLPLNPASNAKILTAAAALTLLGPERRFATSLRADVRGGVARGLTLEGRGDPSLRTADLFDLARQAHAAGLRRVEGDLLVDDTWLGAEHLPPAFDQRPREAAAYRASVGAASVDENALTVRVGPGGPAAVACDPPGYCLVASELTALADRPARVALDAQPTREGRERVRVTGNVPPGAAPSVHTRRLESPPFAAGWALRAALEAVGVRVTGAVRVAAGPAGAAVIARRESLPLSALLYEVGKDSNNFYAEMVLLAVAAGAEGGAGVTAARGAERVVAWARGAGVDVEGLVVRNGSGLYDANRASARQVAGALRAAWRDPAIRDEFVSQLAVAGADGTLRARLREAGAGRVVRAKTGTLDDAVALSGFVLTADPGRALVFSVIANGVRGHGAEARALADQVVARLVRSPAAPPLATP